MESLQPSSRPERRIESIPPGPRDVETLGTKIVYGIPAEVNAKRVQPMAIARNLRYENGVWAFDPNRNNIILLNKTLVSDKPQNAAEELAGILKTTASDLKTQMGQVLEDHNYGAKWQFGMRFQGPLFAAVTAGSNVGTLKTFEQHGVKIDTVFDSERALAVHIHASTLELMNDVSRSVISTLMPSHRA